MDGPPAEIFTASGAGLLATGVMMMLLFFVPRLWKGTCPKDAGKSATPGDWSV
jgi:hypothetical protein